MASALASRTAVRCSFCGRDIDRWYCGGRTPLCVFCADKSGPVLHPARWWMDPWRVSDAAWRIWLGYFLAVTEPSHA